MKTPRNHTHYYRVDGVTIYYRHTGTQAFIWVDEMWKNMPMSEFEHLQPMVTPVDPVSVESVYVPKVGDECAICKGDGITFDDEDLHLIGLKVRVLSVFTSSDNTQLAAFEHIDNPDADCDVIVVSCLRPLPDLIQQRRDELLSKWRSQGQEYAHDTEQSLVSLGMVFDFISELEGE